MEFVKMRKSENIAAADDNSKNKELVYKKKDRLNTMDETKADKPDSRQLDENFRLSYSGEDSWIRFPDKESEKRANFPDVNLKQTEISVSICDHEPLHFGFCYYQDGSGSVNRCYADGLKFLLASEDGSAQVFYPSGLLAILVTVTKAHGRVCIVYDDAPGQPMRALFQSNGRGTCYHTNGKIWLIINQYGGQYLNPEGAIVRTWIWSTLLMPIFLFINKSIGVRVLGEQQVFVSFLANGKQAKFNVGAYCQKGNCKDVQPPSEFSREELLALASEIKIKLLIQKGHQLLSLPSHPFLPNATISPHLHLLAQKLLKAGKELQMSEDDHNFLQSCLKEFL